MRVGEKLCFSIPLESPTRPQERSAPDVCNLRCLCEVVLRVTLETLHTGQPHTNIDHQESTNYRHQYQNKSWKT